MQVWWAHILCQYLPMQLNYFRIGQRCNVYIHGRRFFNTELIKGPWTQEVCHCTPDFAREEKHLVHFIVIFMIFFLQEDDKIIDLVNNYGPPEWSHCKVGKQCRERYSFDCFIFIWFAEMHFPPMCKVNTLVTILCWWIAGQLPELPAADPGMFPNMFNLSALGQVTTVLLLWFSVASTQIMDSPFCHHNATRFTLICSLFGDGRMNPPVIYYASLLFNVLLLLSNSFFPLHRSTCYAATAMTQQVCSIFCFVLEIFLVLWCICLTTLFLG